MAETLFILNTLFTFGALFSLIKVSEFARIFGVHHHYSLSLIIHAVIGVIGYTRTPPASLHVSGASTYFMVVASMTSVWLVMAILGIIGTIVYHFILKFRPSI